MARKKAPASSIPGRVEPFVAEGIERAFKQWLDENTERLITAIAECTQARPIIVPVKPVGELPPRRGPG